MALAFDTLRPLTPHGLQLTPGNLVTEDFEGHVLRAGLPFRTHHGFSFTARKQPVWDEANRCLVPSDSVHPGPLGLPEQTPLGPALETMYPGEALGTGPELERAMAERRRLAVDISHVFIQHEQGVISARTWRLLMDYEHIVEVHASANDGRKDLHRPLTQDTFGLAWARARTRAGTPLVYESYLHKLDDDTRKRQIDLLWS
jgi:hypothetical protein